MSSLKDALTNELNRESATKDLCALIESEVDSKGGLSGIAIKTGYKAVKGIKPGFIDRVVFDLLPEFAESMEPLAEEARSKNQEIGAYLLAQRGRTADALLSVTDKRAERSNQAVIKSFYSKLRSMAKMNVEQAIPGLSKIVTRYTT